MLKYLKYCNLFNNVFNNLNNKLSNNNLFNNIDIDLVPLSTNYIYT